MNWITSKYINKSAIARELGISPDLFRQKLNGINRNRFTSPEILKLTQVATEIKLLINE